MPIVSVWILQKSAITVSAGRSLDGITQGDGSHLVGRSITLNSATWKETFINDNDTTFDDNDTTQSLSGAQTINGVTYANGTRVEAEYTLVLRNPLTGLTYTAYGYNVSTGNPAFATIEGLSFRGGLNAFPPIGTPLQVISAAEGPGSQGQAANLYTNLAYPPCFAHGTRIETPHGPEPIETLGVGDHVLTLDHGVQAIRWVGRIALSAGEVAAQPGLRPVVIDPGALAQGVPNRTLRVSQQHRFVVSGWKADLFFGTDAVLVAARDLVDERGIRLDRPDRGVIYHHLLFDRHEIIWAEGAQTESLYRPGLSSENLPAALLAEVEALFPCHSASRHGYGQVARTCLRPWESQLLVT